RRHDIEFLDEVGYWENALFSAGLVDCVLFYPWQQVAKDMSSCDLYNCRPRVLPDSYLQGHGPSVM
ncbi:MAG: hypothetical protein ACKPKO_10485, partial [Candidatus Fonsibacter sp.]